MTIRGPAVSATSPARAVAAHLRHAVRERRLVSLLAWVPPSPEHELQLLRIRDDLEHGLGRPVALGIGPRYLHATGQLHKGGSDRAVHLLLTCAATPEIPMPDRPGVRFGDLAHAQALADVQALSERGRPVLHLHVEASPTEALEALEELLSAAAPTPGDRRA